VVLEDVIPWAAASSARSASRFTTTSINTEALTLAVGAGATRMGPWLAEEIAGVTDAVDIEGAFRGVESNAWLLQRGAGRGREVTPL
jgi:hypothetical protein